MLPVRCVRWQMASGWPLIRRARNVLAQAGFGGYLAFEPEGWPDAPAPDGVRFCAELAAGH